MNLSLFRVFMSEDVLEPLNNVLMSGFITQGSQVDKFEDELKKNFDFPYILTLNSATSGLTLAVRLVKDKLKLDENSEVLTSPLTCMATNLSILANDLKIKWVDVDPQTCNINLEDLENKITNNTKIIMLIHWGGYPVDLDKINEILNRTELKYGFRPIVIEDCAHSFYAEYHNKKIGTHGNICIFSLQAIKHLTTGDGGLIFLPDRELYDKAKLMRWYGIDRDKRNYDRKDLRMENDVIDWGYKYHMNDINATIGLYNLPHIEELIEKNRFNAQYFYDNLQDIKGLELLENKDDRKPAHWLYTIKVDRKQEFIEYMKEKGIMCSQVHKRNDINTCFHEFLTKLPILNSLEEKMVCIPVGWWLDKKDLEYIVEEIKNFYK